MSTSFLSSQLTIVCDLGVGYAHTFLNGISVFRYDGNKVEEIGKRFYAVTFYNESFVRKEAAEIVSEFIEKQLRESGESTPSIDVEELSKSMINTAVIAPRKQVG